MTAPHPFYRVILLALPISLAFYALLAVGVARAVGEAYTAAPWNPAIYEEPGVTYEQHIANGEAFIAQVRAYAIEHCGEPYLGTVC